MPARHLTEAYYPEYTNTNKTKPKLKTSDLKKEKTESSQKRKNEWIRNISKKSMILRSSANAMKIMSRFYLTSVRIQRSRK